MGRGRKNLRTKEKTDKEVEKKGQTKQNQKLQSKIKMQNI